MSSSEKPSLESDPRFPSGPWTGYFLQPAVPGRHLMELHLTFQRGQMTGEGRDYVGKFIVRGRYFLGDGKCHWTKRYLGKHDVFYQGYNEGKGIWGTWEISAREEYGLQRGGFHIWPEGMLDPTGSHLTAQAGIPLPVSETVEREEKVAEPVGAEARTRSESISASRPGDCGKRERLPAMATHSPVADLPRIVAQLPLAPRTTEVINHVRGGLS